MYHIVCRRVADKWSKTAALLRDPRVAPHIPETRKFTSSNLSAMLNRYGMVVIKPTIGTGGHGIIQIRKGNGNYSYRYYDRTGSFNSFQAMLREVNNIRRGRRYLIQQGIDLATINGRPVDYRVKIQKPGSVWLITGMVGRLARPGLFVTNLCRGGTRLKFSQGVSGSLSPAAVNSMRSKMRSLTRICTNILERQFPGIGQLGFDYGIDRNGKIWIFEVNTKPH